MFQRKFLSVMLISVMQFGCTQDVSHSGNQSKKAPAISYPSSPRVDPIALEDMNSKQNALIGIVEGEPVPKRAGSNLFRTLMHHPDLMEVYLPMGDRVNKAPEIPEKQRELLIMRLAWLYQGKYEWSQHYGKALEAGWKADDLERVKVGHSAPGWSKSESALLLAADQLVKNAFLEDEVWAALREDYSVQDIMTMMTLVTHYHWVAMTTKTLGVQPQRDVIAFNSDNNGSDVTPTEVAIEKTETAKQVTAVAFVEGPIWRADGAVLFTDIPNNRIMVWKENGRAKIYKTPSHHANGLMFDHEGRLLIAEDEGRLVREELDGSITVLAHEYNGAKFNALNDLAIDTVGRIFFTDPAYRNPEKAPQRDENNNPVTGVYRVDTNGSIARVLDSEVTMPNGILVSPGDEFLYVADNDNRSGGNRKLWRFKLDGNGEVLRDTQKLIYDWGTDRGPDGMAIDIAGNIYAASGLNVASRTMTSTVHKGGIQILSPDGQKIGFVAVPIDKVSNVTFGGSDMKTLYITAGHSLWQHKVDIPGYQPN